MVVEIYTVKRIDNSRLRRRTRGFGRLCGTPLAAGGALALALLGYAWQRYENLELRYQLEQLNATQSHVVELNRELRVELATLRSPGRIDLLARGQLGMAVPLPAQIIPYPGRTSGEMADAIATANPASYR